MAAEDFDPRQEISPRLDRQRVTSTRKWPHVKDAGFVPTEKVTGFSSFRQRRQRRHCAHWGGPEKRWSEIPHPRV